MKIIVAYASAGAGHLKSAQSVYEELRQRPGVSEVKIVDILQESRPLYRFLYAWGYAFLVRRAVFLWGLIFRITSLKPFQIFIRPIALVANLLNTRDFARLLISSRPDFVISTHFLPSEITAYLKRKGSIKARLITVITDYGVHPFWLAAGTDKYIAASQATTKELMRSGISQGQILTLGIPVAREFSAKYDRDALFRKLQLDKSRFTVLIVTGSFGIGPIREIAESLHDEVQLLVVCARNRALYKELKEKNYPHVRIFGFIDNIHELMAVSELIITKPGGLSIAESLSMGLLPIFISPIPGQETENARILSQENAALGARGIASVRSAVLELRDDPVKLGRLKEGVRRMQRPYAARELADVIC